MILTRSSPLATMALLSLGEIPPQPLCTNPANTAAAERCWLCVMRAQSTLRPFETARQTPGFNPIKKNPLLSHRSAVWRKQNRSNGELGINSYLIAGAYVGFSLLDLVDPRVCVCPSLEFPFERACTRLHCRYRFHQCSKEKTKTRLK